jgi:prepilin-type N-terminal cleavage/methylation domain-containing protein
MMEVKTMKKEHLDDRGLSLVELLVSVAILSVVLTVVMGFVIFSSDQYHKGNREANLSNESQLLVARLENFLLNASYGVGTGDVADLCSDLGEGAATPETGDVLYIYNRGTDDSTYELICFYPDAGTQKLKYRKYTYTKQPDGTGAWDLKGEEDVSSYVKSFTVDLGELADSSAVTVKLEMELRDRSYTTSNTFVLRNRVSAIRDIQKFEELVK